jgi:hypothetical protein
MGVYIYSLRKKVVKAIMFPENKEATICLAKYVCKPHREFYHDAKDKEYRTIRSTLKRAQNLVRNGFKTDFIACAFEKEATVYIFQPFGWFEDTPDFPFKRYGVIVKHKGQRYIIPMDENGKVNVNEYLPNYQK